MIYCPNCRSNDVRRERRMDGDTTCGSCSFRSTNVKWDEMLLSLHGSKTIEVTIQLSLTEPKMLMTWIGHDFINGGPLVVTSNGVEQGITSAVVTNVKAKP